MLMMAGAAKKHLPEGLPRVDAKFYGKFAPAKDVAADRVSYATDYSMRVPAIVYHPAGATIVKHPGIIVMNAPGDDKSAWYATWAGILYARAGAVVVTYDPLGEYERNKERRSGTGQGNDLAPELADRLKGLTVTDIIQAARYLSERTDVDGKDIAVVGNTQACKVDTEIRICLPAEAGKPNYLTKEAALALNEKLKFPDWTKKQIQAMPETDKDGLRVLGTDVPAVPRADLHAIPEAVWESQQESYIYETWVQRAKAATRSGAP